MVLKQILGTIPPLNAAVIVVLHIRPGMDSMIARGLNKNLPQTESESQNVTLVKGSTILPEQIKWVWSGWLPGGKLVILAGTPGTGKTTILLAIVAVISSGGELPDGSLTETGAVIIWSGEDGVADTLVPRLIAMNANMENVYFVSGSGGKIFDPSKDMPLLSEQAKKIPNLKLIIVDPVVSAIHGDSHKNAEVRRGLQPLVDLGATTGACVVGVSHFNKATIGSNPIDLISGSIAFSAVARVVLGAAKLVEPDSEHGHTRIFCRIKSNIGPDEDGIGYDLKMEPVEGFDGLEASTVLWGQHVTGHSRKLLATSQNDEIAATKRSSRVNEAEEFLEKILSDGPKSQKSIEEAAEGVGIAKRTLDRAKKTLGVESRKGLSGWIWELHEECQRSSLIGNDNLGNFGNVAAENWE